MSIARPTPSTMPGIATGAVASRPSTREPGTGLRDTMYAHISAMPVPSVAVAKPSRKVFFMASCVAENSKNTKWKLASVRPSMPCLVTAVFSSAA